MYSHAQLLGTSPASLFFLLSQLKNRSHWIPNALMSFREFLSWVSKARNVRQAMVIMFKRNHNVSTFFMVLACGTNGRMNFCMSRSSCEACGSSIRVYRSFRRNPVGFNSPENERPSVQHWNIKRPDCVSQLVPPADTIWILHRPRGGWMAVQRICLCGKYYNYSNLSDITRLYINRYVFQMYNRARIIPPNVAA